MNYATLIQDACDKVDGFKALYDEAIKSDNIDNESGAHTVFSIVFVPLLFSAINNKLTQIASLLHFMEEMETCGDELVAEVCEFTVLEELCDEYNHNDIWNLLSNTEETKEAYKCIRRYIQ